MSPNGYEGGLGTCLILENTPSGTVLTMSVELETGIQIQSNMHHQVTGLRSYGIQTRRGIGSEIVTRYLVQSRQYEGVVASD